MMMNKRKTVLVTGGAKRIGAAICRHFAAHGYRVIVHYNQSAKEGIALVEELSGIGIQVDFRQIEAVSNMIPELLKLKCKPDVLINSASVYARATLENSEPQMLHDMFTVNFEAPFELMRSFKLHCKQGCIVNLTDSRTAYNDPYAGTYALAKKTLAAAGETAALEWAPDVRVNAVAPGLVMPPPQVPQAAMEKLLPKIPMQQSSRAEEVAAACLYLAETPSITGETIYIDGGLHLLGHSVETSN